MRLKRLEIMGFKSFADPFRIDFKKGISCIVGPNGCGKSNVADAVRWVLGNQSPKQLRADKMESVIFSGSTKRKQLGMAEVTLTFDNTDRILDLDYDEVSVSRRLFRSGDSEYSINGSRCRLMDITDLVVDKGLGSTGYWILESQMVGTILSSKPEDRRFLFDEAAGIVKYKIQRHRAELKLNSAANDLERLSDIIMEIESTCNGLKKQVSAFNRHSKVSNTISAVREAMSLMESSEIKRILDEKSRLLDETGSVVGRETASLSSGSTILAEARVAFSRVQGKLDDAHRKCADLDRQLASNDRETAVTAEKIASAETRTSENNARMARERERIFRYSADMEKLEDEKLQLAVSLKDMEKEQAESETFLGELGVSLQKAGRLYSDAKAGRQALEIDLEKLRQSYREQIRLEESRLQKLSSITESIDTLTQKEVDLSESIAVLSENSHVFREKTEKLDELLENSIRRHTSLSLEAVELSGAISKKSQITAVLKEQAGRVEKLLQQSSTDDSVSSLIKPLPGMGKAVGAYLDGFNSARPIEEVTSDTPGEGGRYAIAISAVSTSSPVPTGAVSLTECIEHTDESELVVSILSRGVLAPDRITAQQWVRNGLSAAAVTAEGDLFRSDGLVRLGVEASSAGSLELSDMLADLENKLRESAAEVDALNTLKDRVDNQLSTLKKETVLLREELRLHEKKLVGVQTSLESSLRDHGNLVNRISSLKQEKTELEKAGSGSVSHAVEGRITALEEKKSEAVSYEEETLAGVSRADSLLSEATRKRDNCNFSLRENRSRQKEISGRIDILGNEADSLQDLLEELQQENEKSAGTITVLGSRTEELKKQNALLNKRRGEEESVRNDFSTERNSLMESSAVLEKEVQQIREKLGRAKSRMMELEAQAASLQEKLDNLGESCAVEDNPFLGLSHQELSSELVSRSAVLERIGPVNMLAVSEYREASERLEYLTEQRIDLDKARASLARAITEINAEAAQRFKETFAKVRENFQNMFLKLFGGGEGDIIAIESEDPLEGGIEIMARPRGKKLKNVIALSAGEKALTAVALLFSLYLVKPSPFCVLDELDGPFDDSNTDKFMAILRDFSGNTQFIVITHNKRTMEEADVLYGITMAEEGVSTITSVSLEDMEKNK